MECPSERGKYGVVGSVAVRPDLKNQCTNWKRARGGNKKKKKNPYGNLAKKKYMSKLTSGQETDSAARPPRNGSCNPGGTKKTGHKGRRRRTRKKPSGDLESCGKIRVLVRLIAGSSGKNEGGGVVRQRRRATFLIRQKAARGGAAQVVHLNKTKWMKKEDGQTSRVKLVDAGGESVHSAPLV